jgi:hypothetical protein
MFSYGAFWVGVGVSGSANEPIACLGNASRSIGGSPLNGLFEVTSVFESTVVESAEAPPPVPPRAPLYPTSVAWTLVDGGRLLGIFWEWSECASMTGASVMLGAQPPCLVLSHAARYRAHSVGAFLPDRPKREP